MKFFDLFKANKLDNKKTVRRKGKMMNIPLDVIKIICDYFINFESWNPKISGATSRRIIALPQPS